MLTVRSQCHGVQFLHNTTKRERGALCVRSAQLDRERERERERERLILLNVGAVVPPLSLYLHSHGGVSSWPADRHSWSGNCWTARQKRCKDIAWLHEPPMMDSCRHKRQGTSTVANDYWDTGLKRVCLWRRSRNDDTVAGNHWLSRLKKKKKKKERKKAVVSNNNHTVGLQVRQHSKFL